MKNLLAQYTKQNILVKFIAAGWLLLVVVMPFHAFISTWGGIAIGPLQVWKVWKEILLIMLVSASVVQSFVDKDMFKLIWSQWLTKLIVGYGLLHLLIALLLRNQTQALFYGLAINLRFLVIFLIAQIVFYYIKPTQKELIKLVLIPAAIVTIFGLLQMFLLPYDFLTHFGYKKGVTIAPFSTIDQQLDKLRAFSTLRGPNPLGAYLILPILLVAGSLQKLTRSKKIKTLLLATCYLLFSLTVLYGSQSRSAWLGLVVGLAAYILLSVDKKWRYTLIGAGLICIMIGSFSIYQLRDTSFVQNVILHDNPNIGPEQTSNSDHLMSNQGALNDIVGKPLTGCGPGCAGPASFYDPDGTKLAENYYLQIGQEVGVLGLILFITIIVTVGYRLYKQKSDTISLILLASLVGISLANMLLHVWADDTIAYVWWGVAGAVLSTQYLNITKNPS